MRDYCCPLCLLYIHSCCLLSILHVHVISCCIDCHSNIDHSLYSHYKQQHACITSAKLFFLKRRKSLSECSNFTVVNKPAVAVIVFDVLDLHGNAAIFPVYHNVIVRKTGLKHENRQLIKRK